MTAGESGATSPRSAWFTVNSPIGMVGGFTAIVELGLIFAASFTDGAIQWAFLIFAVVAFFFVIGQFFDLPRKKNWVLYRPEELGDSESAAKYVTAVDRGNRTGEQVLIGETVTKSVSIVFGAATPNSLPVLVELDAHTTVTEFLGKVGNGLLPPIPDETVESAPRRYSVNYGVSWVLRPSEQHPPILDVGPRWSWPTQQALDDFRLVSSTELAKHGSLELHVIRDLPLSFEQLALDGYCALTDVIT